MSRSDRNERNGSLLLTRSSSGNLSDKDREKDKERIRAALFTRNTSTFMTLVSEATTTNDYKRVRDFYYRNYDKINLPKARILSRVDFSHNEKLREFLVEIGMALDGDNLALDSPMVCALNAAPTADMEAVEYFALLGSDVVACDSNVLENVVKKNRPDVAPVLKLLSYGVPSNYIPCPALKSTYTGENALFDYAIDNDHFDLARTLQPDYDQKRGNERREEDQAQFLATKDPFNCRYYSSCCFCLYMPWLSEENFLFHPVPSDHNHIGGSSVRSQYPCFSWYCWFCGCGLCCFGPGGLHRYCHHQFAICQSRYASVACSRITLASCVACTVTPCVWCLESFDQSSCNPFKNRIRLTDTCCHCCYSRHVVQEAFRGEPMFIYEESPTCCRCCC
jgi:hypothetical protein